MNVRAVAFAGLLLAQGVGAAIPQSERDALVELYAATNGPGWSSSAGWLGAAGTECSWSGVKCDAAATTVIKLEIAGRRLDGTIPDSIGNLTNLTELDLSDNTLRGPIPSRLWSLSKLTFLDLARNQLSGAIPPGITGLESLTTLWLDGNQLTGAVPAELSDVDTLERLSLGRNLFSTNLTTLVQIVHGLPNLRVLSLREMGFEGRLPESLGDLVSIRSIDLFGNRLSGPISEALAICGRMPDLENLSFYGNSFEGELPDSLDGFGTLRELNLTENRISGSIPAGIGALESLRELSLGFNALTGPIPREIGDLASLRSLFLNHNDLTGPIPPELGNLTGLWDLVLDGNRLTGPFPVSVTELPELGWLSLYDNQLSGPLPPEIGDFEEIVILELDGNQFSGPIPAEVGNLGSYLLVLQLGSNLFEGEIPDEIGNLTELWELALYSNNLRGEVPFSILNLAGADIDMSDNALRAGDPSVAAFLEETLGYPFEDFQTIPPTNIEVREVTAHTVSLTWNAIGYSWEPGGYQILASTTPGGPYLPVVTTSSKYDLWATVAGLDPSTTYHFIMKTVTYPHGSSPYFQLNTVFSDPSTEVSATTLDASTVRPDVIITDLPDGLLQAPGIAGGTDGYTLTNVGGASTTVALGREGDFFDQQPSAFSLAPGASQRVTLTGRAMPSGEYSGASLVEWDGVSGRIHVTMSVASLQSANYRIEAVEPRIDLVAPSELNPSGVVTFRNVGEGSFTGVASADVEFLEPQRGLITIAPGESVGVEVTANRSLRPDVTSLQGTLTGQVSLIGIGGFDERSRASASGASGASLVTVADTVKPGTSSLAPPPLLPGDVALFLTGVGHVRGSVGEFVTDVSILDPSGVGVRTRVDLFYTPSLEGAPSRTVSYELGAGTNALALADAVKSVFDGTAEVGTLQIRTSAAARLSVSANVFNRSNAAGYYGTSIPLLRSDRSVHAGEDLFLTGLRKDPSGHTNLYLQETVGKAVTVRLDLLSAGGEIIRTVEEELEPFRMRSLLDPLDEGTIAVRVVAVGGDGAVAAYATPVDRASGDTWAVADWGRHLDYSPRESVVIPVAGAVRGANDTHFKTDVAITNRCGSVDLAERDGDCTAPLGRGILRYFPATGGVLDREIELPLLGTRSMADVVRTEFGIETDTIGHLVFVPMSGSFAVTSRTYTVVAGSPATFGSTVPAIGQLRAIRAGQSRRIGALTDTTRATTAARTPATSRTNFGIVETSGNPAKVRVSVYHSDPKALSAGAPLGIKVFDLAPNQFISQSNLVESIVGPQREELYGNLSGVQVQFDVMSQTGAIVVWTSSVDNGTGDSILRTE